MNMTALINSRFSRQILVLAIAVHAYAAGGGLKVIANAPNPAGQVILKNHFDGSVSPAGLFRAAVVPTLIVFGMFMLFR